MTGQTALELGRVGCRQCAQLASDDDTHCQLCGARLTSRNLGSIYWLWFWWALGVLAYIPANIWPMLQTRMLFEKSEDTIIEGALKLTSHGSYAVAAIIVLASVVIPIAKLAAVAYLGLAIQFKARSSAKWRHWLYEVVEFIGRWSMVDVFVVAILSSLVQFSLIATVQPGLAALAFACSVIFTMLAAQSVDSRLIWDLDRPAS